ncbi:trafficking protein particle complex subunit 23 [Monosporozyma unispora]|nr:hypothetical protein C6P44_002316 [Kazachstania unispora]
MGIEAILIINKSGGLIYHRSFTSPQVDPSNPTITSTTKHTLNSNDLLILASTLHSVFAISSQITPKALQLSQSNINYTIPYHPYVGVANPQTTPKNNMPTKYGSFKGDDYFKEPFHNWNKSGLKQLSTDQFTMYIYQTMTGLKFVAISSSVLPSGTGSGENNNNAGANTVNINGSQYNMGSQIADNLLRKVYCVYSDYVMKDPFYSLEMPIKSDLFDDRVKSLIDHLL